MLKLKQVFEIIILSIVRTLIVVFIVLLILVFENINSSDSKTIAGGLLLNPQLKYAGKVTTLNFSLSC